MFQKVRKERGRDGGRVEIGVKDSGGVVGGFEEVVVWRKRKGLDNRH